MRIKPSKREKKRYIVYEIDAEKQISFKEAKNAITKACLRYLGEFGFEKTKLYIIGNTYKNNRGILRTTNKTLDDIKKTLKMIKTINNTKTNVNIKGISGILKKAKNKFLGG